MSRQFAQVRKNDGSSRSFTSNRSVSRMSYDEMNSRRTENTRYRNRLIDDSISWDILLYQEKYDKRDTRALMNAHEHFFRTVPIPCEYFKDLKASSSWTLSLSMAKINYPPDAMDMLISYLSISSVITPECDDDVIDFLDNNTVIYAARKNSILLKDIIDQACIKGRSKILEFMMSIFPKIHKQLITTSMCAKGFAAAWTRVLNDHRCSSLPNDVNDEFLHELKFMLQLSPTINHEFISSFYATASISIDNDPIHISVARSHTVMKLLEQVTNDRKCISRMNCPYFTVFKNIVFLTNDIHIETSDIQIKYPWRRLMVNNHNIYYMVFFPDFDDRDITRYKFSIDKVSSEACNDLSIGNQYQQMARIQRVVDPTQDPSALQSRLSCHVSFSKIECEYTERLNKSYPSCDYHYIQSHINLAIAKDNLKRYDAKYNVHDFEANIIRLASQCFNTIFNVM